MENGLGTLPFLRKITYVWLMIKLLEMAAKRVVEQNAFGTREDSLEVRQVKWDILFCSVRN